MDHAQKAIELAIKKGGVPEATIWGSHTKAPMGEAAFANATTADVLDWEDCTWTGHASAGTVPVGIAVSEALHKSGADFLTAMVAGYEGYWRIAMSCQASREYITSGHAWGLVSWQIYACGIPAGKLFGFNADQMNQLMGAMLYQSFVCCNKHSMGPAKSDIYHFAHGYCARNGIEAAEVTKIGFDNCRDAFDGKNGYWCKVSDRVDWDWYGKELGTKWYIMETCLKRWPVNIWIETPMDLMERIMQKRPFQKDDVKEIVISPNPKFLCFDFESTTRTTMDAEFNIPFCLSSYIVNQKPGAHWYTHERLHDPELIALTKKFRFTGEERVPNDNFDEFKQGTFPEVTMEVLFQDGTSIKESMRHCKGHPLNNFTFEEEKQHFRMCCESVFPEKKIEQIIAMVSRLEQLDDMAKLGELLGQ